MLQWRAQRRTSWRARARGTTSSARATGATRGARTQATKPSATATLRSATRLFHLEAPSHCCLCRLSPHSRSCNRSGDRYSRSRSRAASALLTLCCSSAMSCLYSRGLSLYIPFLSWPSLFFCTFRIENSSVCSNCEHDILYTVFIL